MSKEIHNRAVNRRIDERDPAHGKALLELDRAGWAWEWLRRNPAFLAVLRQSVPNPQPSVPIGEQSDSVPEQLRIVEISDAYRFKCWGVVFRRRISCSRARGKRVLASRRQSGCACSGSAAGRA